MNGWSENISYTPEEAIQYKQWFKALCGYWDQERLREEMAAKEALNSDDSDQPKVIMDPR